MAESAPANPHVRIFYRKEAHPESGDRMICVAYTHDREAKLLKYASAVFRKETPRETCDKKKLRHTATERLKVRPVVVENVEDTSTLKDFQDYIRSLMYTRGSKGDRL